MYTNLQESNLASNVALNQSWRISNDRLHQFYRSFDPNYEKLQFSSEQNSTTANNFNNNTTYQRILDKRSIYIPHSVRSSITTTAKKSTDSYFVNVPKRISLSFASAYFTILLILFLQKNKFRVYPQVLFLLGLKEDIWNQLSLTSQSF